MSYPLRLCIPVLLMLCAVFVTAPTLLLAQNAPVYTGIDHVELAVTDVERTLDFYTKLFGTDLWKDKRDAGRHYLHLGQSWLAVDAQDTARIAHMGFEVGNFSAALVQGWLRAQSIPWQELDADALHVDDRDAIRTQVDRAMAWDRLTSTHAAPEPRAGDGAPIFTAYAIDEIFLTVTNLEVDSLFYSRLLDQSGSLQAGSLWFQVGNSSRLRITQAPVGQRPGLAWFAVHVAYTDMEAAAEAVFAAGGIIENILPNGFSFWDPDGIRVVVRSGDLY